MRSLILRSITALVLLTCVVCPLVEMFDCWDKTLQNGSDTEFTFVVIALCLGVVYRFARFLCKCPLLRAWVKRFADALADLAFGEILARFSSRIRISISPPIAALRI